MKVALKKQQMTLQTRSLNLKEYHKNWDLLQALYMKENQSPFEEAMIEQLLAWLSNNKLF